MLELSKQDPQGPVADPAVDDGRKFLEDLAAKEKAAEEDAMRQRAAEAIKAKAKQRNEPKPEPVPAEPKIAPDYPVGRVFGRLGQYGGDRVVVDKDKFYKLCVRMVRTNPRLATMYVRMIGELLGIDNFYEAQAKWQEINSYHERKPQ